MKNEMKKIAFIIIAFIVFCMLLTIFSKGQTTSQTFKVPKTYQADSIVVTKTISNPVIIYPDTAAIVALKCGVVITPPPPPTVTAMFYIDKWLSRLGVTAEEDKTIAYAIQTGYNVLSIYSLGTVFADPLLTIKQRAFNKKAHVKFLKLEAEISGSPSSVAQLLTYNSLCADPSERFDFACAEWEPWNQIDLVAAAIKDTTQLKSQKIALAPTAIPGTEYWGWLKKFSSKFQEVLMKNTSYLPLHYYQGIPSISYHSSETDSLNTIAKRNGFVYDIKPIFSWESVFSNTELGRQGSPRKIYDNWKVGFDAKHYSNLVSTGYYGFAQSHQETIIPYKAPTSFLRSIFTKKYIQDGFINETSPEHLLMSIPPN
jgi:hypothetical protein